MPTIPLYRYYNAGNGDHFYTTNYDELGGGYGGYTSEGIAGYVYPNPLPELPFEPNEVGLVPLYRYYNAGNGDHFYTTNYDELGGGYGGYISEGVACWIYETGINPQTVTGFLSQYYSDVPKPVKLYRYYNAGNGDHFYTTNYDELGDGYGGYTSEGIAGYVHNSRPIEG
jgi:hypothetical protein